MVLASNLKHGHTTHFLYKKIEILTFVGIDTKLHYYRLQNLLNFSVSIHAKKLDK